MALLSQQLLTLRDQYCSLRVLLNTSFSQPSESRKYFKEMQFVEVWGLWKQENINFHFSKTNFECVKRFVVPFRSRTQSS